MEGGDAQACVADDVAGVGAGGVRDRPRGLVEALGPPARDRRAVQHGQLLRQLHLLQQRSIVLLVSQQQNRQTFKKY